MTHCIFVEWQDGVTYQFEYKYSYIHPTKGNKKLYFGHFVKTAPEGISPNEDCCLKEISMNSLGSQHPAAREENEFIQLKGEHLCPVLALNPAAKQVLAGNSNVTSTCYAVVPWYASSDTIFNSYNTLTMSERIRIIQEYTAGVQELQQNTADGSHYIDAHRDIKYGNGVVEYTSDDFRIRLIDFASIHAVGGAAMLNRSIDATIISAFSGSNTAPEDLYDPQKVSAKTDVYALGMMLASLFLKVSFDESSKAVNGKSISRILDHAIPNRPYDKWEPKALRCNPNFLIYCIRSCTCPDPSNALLTLHQASADCDSQEADQQRNGANWVEDYLKRNNIDLSWETEEFSTCDGNAASLYHKITDQIHSLFVESVRIDPDKRMTLKQFCDTLRDIQERLRELDGLLTEPLRSSHPALQLDSHAPCLRGAHPDDPEPSSASSVPFSIAVFSQKLLATDPAFCLTKAQEVLKKEQVEQSCNNLQWHCFSLKDGNCQEHGMANSAESLRKLLSGIPNSILCSDNQLSMALLQIGNYLYEHESMKKNFNGSIHFFLSQDHLEDTSRIPCSIGYDDDGNACSFNFDYIIDDLSQQLREICSIVPFSYAPPFVPPSHVPPTSETSRPAIRIFLADGDILDI